MLGWFATDTVPAAGTQLINTFGEDQLNQANWQTSGALLTPFYAEALLEVRSNMISPGGVICIGVGVGTDAPPTSTTTLQVATVIIEEA